MANIRSNKGPCIRLFMTGLVGFLSLLMVTESASAYTLAAVAEINTIEAAGLTSLIRPPRDGFGEPRAEPTKEMVGASKVIELAQYGSVRRVSRRTARRTSRRN